MQIKNKRPRSRTSSLRGRQLFSIVLSVVLSVFLVAGAAYATLTFSGTTITLSNSETIDNITDGVINFGTTKLTQGYTSTSATGGEDAFTLTVTDSKAQTSGMTRGLVVAHNVSGAKSGTADSEGINVDMTLSANTAYTYGTGVYVADSGNKTHAAVFGSQVYIAGMGSGTQGSVIGSYIGMEGTPTVTGRHAALRLVTHAGTTKSGILYEGVFTTGIDMTGTTGGGDPASFTTGLKMGNATTGINLAGVYTTGINLSGTFTTALAVTNAKMTQGYTSTSATGGENAFTLTLTDSKAQTTGMTRGIVVAHNVTGAKSGDADSEGINVDMTLTSATANTFGTGVYVVDGGSNANHSGVYGSQVYMADMGTGTLGNVVGSYIGMESTHVASSRNAALWLATHTGTTKSGILYQGAFTTGIDMTGTTGGATAATFTTGIKMGDATTGINLAGVYTTALNIASGKVTQATALSGATAGDAFATTVTDSGTASSGYSRGVYVSYTQSGVKTGTAEVNPLAVDMGITANVPKAYATSLYTAVTGDRTVDQLSALYYYGDALPNPNHVNNWYALDIEMDNAVSATGNSSFMYVYNHTGTNLIGSVIRLGGESTGVATYLVDFAANAMEPVAANTCSTNSVASDGSIKIRIGSTDYYIPYFTLTNCD